jgi:hypothetical protein
VTNTLTGRAALAVVLAAFLGLAACGRPAQPFEFTATTSDLAMGTGTVEVRLKNTASGTFVNDAVITAVRLDMEPDGMKDMTSPVEAQGASAPGTYRFSGNFKMAGQWQLSLSAQVPGQAQPVQGVVVFNVK